LAWARRFNSFKKPVKKPLLEPKVWAAIEKLTICFVEQRYVFLGTIGRLEQGHAIVLDFFEESLLF
jgi:hypothetical protein